MKKRLFITLVVMFAGYSVFAKEYFSFKELGSFRIPMEKQGESNISYSQGPVTLGSNGNSLFIVGHVYQQAIAELSIPSNLRKGSINTLPMAEFKQPFTRVLHKAPTGNKENINRIIGLKLIEGQLFVNGVKYYDASASNRDTTVIIRQANNLQSSNVAGFFQFRGRAHAAGWMSKLPKKWNKLLGAEYISGFSSGIPINGRLSMGPSAFTFFPFGVLDKSENSGIIYTETLLDFDLKTPLHKDLKNKAGKNQVWTQLSSAKFGFVLPERDYYLTIGNSGGHNSEIVYKYKRENGEACPGDCAVDKSDWSNYFWLWDMTELLEVKEGKKAPYQPRPVSFGVFDRSNPKQKIIGATFDYKKHILYVSFDALDTFQSRYEAAPIITAYKLVQG